MTIFILNFLFILLFVLLGAVNCQYGEVEEKPQRRNYCAAYTECVSVSILEERLCLGNSIWRPFWLPQRNDPSNCHKKMRSDYENLEHLEEEADSQMNACLNENSSPLDKKLEYECKFIGRTPRFIIGRTITYVPNNCFAGTKRRIERQCTKLAECCPPIEKCKLLTSESTVHKLINTTRENLRKRAGDCQKGLELAPSAMGGFQFSLDNDQNEQIWSPTGHVNVNFNDRNSIKNDDIKAVDGHVNVRFTTVPDNEDRARKLLIRYGDRRVENGATGSPSLFYPPSPRETTRKGFERKFQTALDNTNTYKKHIEKLNRGSIAKEGFDSLIDAATASENADSAPPIGTITLSENNDNIPEESENSIISSSDSVTSSPIIFVGNPTLLLENYTKPDCKEAASSKLANILSLLGENKSNADFKQVHALLKKFENETTRKNLTEKQKTRSLLVEKALIDMFNRFETQNVDEAEMKNKEANVKSVLDNTELKFCEEPQESIKPAESTNSTILVDDNGDKFIIEKGTTTLFVGEEDPKLTEVDFLKEKPKEVKTMNFISEEYKKEIKEFRRSHHLWSMNSTKNPTKREDTTCDIYMRCRNQMHMAVDSCAWRFASDELLATIAESAESLLYKSEKVCSQKDGDQLSMLYETVITRNNKLRNCLFNKNQKVFEESVCLAYSAEKRIQYDLAIKRILNETFEYSRSRDCFSDANLIQEKCTILRDCCPNFDKCREETFDVETERTLINLTASINDIKQECVKKRAKEAVKHAVRELLLSSDEKPVNIDSKSGLEISQGARIVRMARYRV